MSFGKNLESLRKQKGWSQDKLAEKLNLSRQAISKWENETNKPDIDNVKSISKLFAIRIDDLLDNELPEKAAKVDVRKAEKKEAISKIVKYMVIAIILLYLISVIYKFASLLIIVNGVQKYANLDNYYYRITTYDESGLVEKEECWFKDGVSKTVNSSNGVEKVTFIDYNSNEGYIISSTLNEKINIDVQEYNAAHKNYRNGGQLIDKFPRIIGKNYLSESILNSLNLDVDINIYGEGIIIKTRDNYIALSKNSLLPTMVYKQKNNTSTAYWIDFNSINDSII